MVKQTAGGGHDDLGIGAHGAYLAVNFLPPVHGQTADSLYLADAVQLLGYLHSQFPRRRKH